jgi:AbrB family looped-hinge helix DNA binding protein
VIFVEQFVVRVFQGGKVTIPKRVRELLDVEDGDYVRLGVVEVMHALQVSFARSIPTIVNH